MTAVENESDLTQIMRDIANGRRNKIGDPWSISWCDDAASEIDRLRTALAAAEARADDRDKAAQQHFTQALENGAKVSALRAQLAQAAEALEWMIRLADMGFEESMKEPQENGNFAAYENAKRVVVSITGEAKSDD
jgi:hypothetical protein